MAHGGSKVKTNLGDVKAATMPTPEISRNFCTIGGILQTRWFNPTLNAWIGSEGPA